MHIFSEQTFIDM